MSKIAMALIDGTGDWNDGDYAVNMATSFCSQLRSWFCRHGERANVHYERGPSGEGYRIEERGERAAQFLAARKDAADKLWIAGYSRGGSCAIFAANHLKANGLDVDALFLFDPVARHLTRGGEGIPSNVKYSRTALRTRDPALVKKYADTASLAGVNLTGSFPYVAFDRNPMRPSFGNISLTAEGGGTHDRCIFKGSHGALGGVGWQFMKDVDGPCEIAVASYMNEAFAAHGFAGRLVHLL